MMLHDKKLAQYIDYTILKPNAAQETIMLFCDQAKKHQFQGVCVNPSHIALVAKQLKKTNIKPIAVVAFPLGASSTSTKAFETRDAVRQGALEIDMVINLGALKSQQYKFVYQDILAVVQAAAPHIVKVIIETMSLTEEEKIMACVLSQAAGAGFVKTSTGFGQGGAMIEDIQLMRRILSKHMKIKASGGIRTKQDAEKMIQAGADRIGTSQIIA
jgi:deoxyribose-phosphate aldolase